MTAAFNPGVNQPLTPACYKGLMFTGLDVGGSFVKGASVQADGRVVARLREPVARGSAGALGAAMLEVARV